MSLKDLITKIYGDATGPFGFPMQSETAKEVDTFFKTLPKECRDYGFKHVTCIPMEKDIGKEGTEDDRTDVSLITNDALDRDYEVMLPKGADWRQFMKNPIVPFAHQYNTLPIGKALWVKRNDKKGKDGWLAKTKYSTKPKDWSGDWFADAVWHMVSAGDLPGKSIGFIPTEMRPVEEKDLKERPELAKARVIISKYLVLEYSIAPVQSNPDALVATIGKCRQKGISVPSALLEELGILVPYTMPSIGKDAEEVQESILTLPPHVTLEEAEKSLPGRVGKLLQDIDIDKIVDECVARRQGKV